MSTNPTATPPSKGPKSERPYVDGRLSAYECASGCADAVSAGKDSSAFRCCIQLSDDLKAVAPARLEELTEVAAPLTGDWHYDALLAGVVESICVEAGVRVPAWTNEETRFCDKWYVCDLVSLQEEADLTSPEAFRRRGVYVLPSDFESC